MKITAPEEYGLRCLLRLARAADGQSLTIQEIAAAEGLSGPYAAKLLAMLGRKGLVKGRPGWGGGYRLARPAADIGLGAVLMSLGEPLYEDPGYCQRHAGSETENGQCVHINGCTLRALWQTLEQWMRHLLDQISLADLMQSEQDIAGLLRSRLEGALTEAPATLMPLGMVKEEKELA
jgi:Rrf2 family protein